MKKLFVFCLTAALALTASACSQEDKTPEEPQTTASKTETAEMTQAEAGETDVAFSGEKKDALDSLLKKHKCKGTAYLTLNGEAVYQYADGEDIAGGAITIDTLLPVGSVSKQFCAAAVMSLRDSGKLSVDDTLDKYFPDFTEGKRLTIKNLLSMRSGISDAVTQGVFGVASEENTYEQNRQEVLTVISATSLTFEPDTRYEYSNSNYMLLSAIVEQVSGQTYIDYLRQTFFEPLGMTHTGSIDEMQTDSPAWANGLQYPYAAGIATGAGDIVSTAPDMDKWMTGLRNGTVVSSDTFREMTTDYSSDSAQSYGYGFMLSYNGGVGHPGNIVIGIDPYTAFDYIGADSGYNLIMEGCGQYSTDLFAAVINTVL